MHHDVRRGDLLLAGVLGVVTAALRAGPLRPSSLWLDDAWLALATRAGGVGDAMAAGLTSPGFAVLLNGVTTVVGFSELRAQLLPFALAVVTPPVVFLAARHGGVVRSAALAGAAVLMAAPAHITYSSRVKPYTADALAGALVLWAGWRILQRPDARGPWIALLVAGTAGIVVSAGSAPTVLAVALVVSWVAYRRRCLRPAVPVLGALGLICGGWLLAVVSPAVTPQLERHWDGFFSARRLPGVLADAAPGPEPLGLLLFAGSAGVVLMRDRRLGALLTMPAVVAAALAATGQVPLGGGRIDIHLYPSLALLVAAAAGTLRVPAPARTAGCLALAALLLVGAPAPAPYPPDDIRPLVREVERTDVPVLVYPTTRWAYALYTRHPVEIRRDRSFIGGFIVEIDSPRVFVLPSQRRVPARHRPAVTAVAAPLDRVWLVVTQARPDLEAIEDTLRELGFRAGTALSRPGASATLWERDGIDVP